MIEIITRKVGFVEVKIKTQSTTIDLGHLDKKEIRDLIAEMEDVIISLAKHVNYVPSRLF